MIRLPGGGPAGHLSFYAHLRQAKVKIIDSRLSWDGQPNI